MGQTSHTVIYLSPMCLPFWIQHLVLDPCVPESKHVLGYMKVGLWLFCPFIWSNLYVQTIPMILMLFWWQVELLSLCLAVWAGWWITAQGNLCRRFLDSFQALSWAWRTIDSDNASRDLSVCWSLSAALLRISRQPNRNWILPGNAYF